jgi:death-on-curing protein
MREPIWVHAFVVRAVHGRQIAEHGGPPGIRDTRLMEAALAHPRHVWQYEDSASVPRLAAAYAHALTRDHPFIDGNQRVALVVLLLFLDLKGWRLDAPEEDLYVHMLELAAGNTSEEMLASWLEDRCRSSDENP